jgi:hypothetical protein
MMHLDQPASPTITRVADLARRFSDVNLTDRNLADAELLIQRALVGGVAFHDARVARELGRALVGLDRARGMLFSVAARWGVRP